MQRGEGGFRLGAAWVHFGFPPHGAALSTEDGCWRCKLEAPSPSGAHLPGRRAWERGWIQPIRCTCPETLGQSDVSVPTFPANLMHRPETSQPIRCICRVLFGQSVCPDPGPPAGVRAGTSGTGARGSGAWPPPLPGSATLAAQLWGNAPPPSDNVACKPLFF